MGKIVLHDGRVIGDGERPYIIAEMNSSHNGKLERAMEMIDYAKACGCDCVKFQSWTADTLYSQEYYDQNPISKRMVQGFSLQEEQLLQLWHHCKEIGIDFSSTPYSEKEVEFLVQKVQVPFIKVASMEINHIPFLEYIAKKQMPIVLSTGMSSYEEVERAVQAIVNTGNQNLCILHCVSVYPAEPKLVNLNNMKYLKEKYPQFAIGYSDHTIGCEVACGAVALGAGMIEKHFTLDNSRMGMDNNMATEPEEMGQLVQKCHHVYQAMGTMERTLSAEEGTQAKKMRRSIVAKEKLPVGTILTQELLAYKRPGTGLEPGELHTVLGKRTLKEIQKGYRICTEDIE